MARINIDCSECCNTSTVVTSCKEPVGYCPLCGAGVVLPEAADDDDDDYDDEDDD